MKFKDKGPFNSLTSSIPRRAGSIHMIVCPFCDNGHSIPTDFDSIHHCTCGAGFKVCGTDMMENGVGDIANSLWNEEELGLVRSVPVDFCNIVIERDFDRLLAIRHTSTDNTGIERFCKYDVHLSLNLVWVKRLF